MGTPETESEGHVTTLKASWQRGIWLVLQLMLLADPKAGDEGLDRKLNVLPILLGDSGLAARGHFIEFEQRQSLFRLSQAFQRSHAPKLEACKPHPQDWSAAL
ncbi:MAG TPA: hypothetical protein VK681_01740 [Reyranella sp.]|nr:hypothetical protein [Reyranella sp.]